MTNKFSTKKFGVNENQETENKPFERDNSDNKVFPEIQVKDISTIITEDCVGMLDSDTPIYQICSNLENKFIKVTHKKDDSITAVLDGIREFKGLGKKISPQSWLGARNVERELENLPHLKVEDFNIEAGQELKMDKDKAIETAKIQIYGKLKNIKNQFNIPKITMVLGEGDNFRHKLKLCRPYKGNRSETLRPLILKEIRQWCLDELGAIITTERADGEMVEADDVVEIYGSIGYQHYRKTGKFNYVVLASDKDARGNPKLLIDPDTHKGKDNPLKGKFKYPQAMLIEATDRTCGDLEIITSKSGNSVKGYGLKWLMYQAVLGSDPADNYDAIGHLDRKLDFGDLSAYKVLKPCKTAQECIQACVDVFTELLPYGVQYTTHDGIDMDVPTIEYMNTYFLCAYMNRSRSDTMDFFKLCKAFNVDTSKVIDNNKLTPPEPTFDKDNAEKGVAILKEMCEDVVSEIGTYKSLKKPELVDKLSVVLDRMNHMKEQFDDFYVMVQKPKDKGE